MLSVAKHTCTCGTPALAGTCQGVQVSRYTKLLVLGY